MYRWIQKAFITTFHVAKRKTVLMAFYMFFSIYNCTTYFKNQLIVKSITNMQEKRKNLTFLVTNFRPPPPLNQSFLPNKKTYFKYWNIYLFPRHQAIAPILFLQYRELDNGVLAFRKVGVYRSYGHRSFGNLCFSIGKSENSRFFRNY